MITRIELRLIGLFGPPTVYQATMTAAAATVALANETGTAESAVSQTLTGSDARQWLTRLAALHLPDWADRYAPQPDQVVPAGTQWTLTLDQDEGPQRVMTGASVYPPNWSALVDLLRQAALASNGHLQPPVRWQFDFIRFADLQLPEFHGLGETLDRTTIYQETILIDAAQQTLYVETRYPDPQPSHTETYQNASLVTALIPAVADALAPLGNLTTMRLDTTVDPDAAFGIILTYPENEQIVVQTDADDPAMLNFWQQLKQLVTTAITAAQRESANAWRQLGPAVAEYYVAVTFNHGGKPYTYKTDIPDLDIDDQVVVPVGANGHTLTGTVVDVWDDVPPDLAIPESAIKTVVRRAD